MLLPDATRTIQPARRSLLRMAISAKLDGDADFFNGLEPAVRRELSGILESLDQLVALVRKPQLALIGKCLPRIVDEILEDGWSETAAQFIMQDYRSIPVSPQVFLSSPYYAGKYGEGLYEVNRKDACRILDPASRTFEVILTGSTRWGKAQPLDAKLLTPTGWIEMRDVVVDDLVIGSDGKPHPVLGVYPQGLKKVFRVTFSDGSSTECCDDHLWSVKTKSGRCNGSPWRVLSLSTIRKFYEKRPGRGTDDPFYIPLVEPVCLEPKRHMLHPYLVGALIGDGGLTRSPPRITCSNPGVLQGVSKYLPSGVTARHIANYDYSLSGGRTGGKPNVLTVELRRLGLDTLSENKRVPQEYLFDKASARLAMLQGLMDTDGSVEAQSNKVEFCTVSAGLAEDLVFLVQSLGGTATHHVNKSFLYGKRHLDRHRIRLQLPDWCHPFLFHSERRARYHPRTKFKPVRAIRSITPVGQKMCQCIQVGTSDGLYLTDSCILTHNTTLAVMLQAYRMYLLSLLRDPQSYFGLMRGSSIRYGIFNIFKYKTQDIYERLRSILDDSPYFQEQFPRLNANRTQEIELPNHISVVEGSQELHALGETLIGAILDEVNFMRIPNRRTKAIAHETLGQAHSLYTAIRGRLRNQWVNSPGSAAPYLMCLLSQRLAQTSFLEEHIARYGHDAGVIVISRAIWDVQPEGRYSGKKFWVFCGDTTAPPRILTDEEVPQYASNSVAAPIEHLEDAKTNLEDFIRNAAGRATVAASALFRRPEVIKNAWCTDLAHPFKVPYVMISTRSPLKIQDVVRTDVMFKVSQNNFVPRVNSSASRVLHIDLAATRCSAGMACVHMSMAEDAITPLYWVDFLLRIDPPAPGYGQIDFDKIVDFVKYLTQNGFHFQLVSFDSYQSRHSVQILDKMGINSDFVSVDETDDPYINLRGVFESGQVRMYPYPIVHKELAELEHDITAQKVFKPYSGSKDVSDALAAAVYGLIPEKKRISHRETASKMALAGSVPPRITVVGG